jgi:hypothetical protein
LAVIGGALLTQPRVASDQTLQAKRTGGKGIGLWGCLTDNAHSLISM